MTRAPFIPFMRTLKKTLTHFYSAGEIIPITAIIDVSEFSRATSQILCNLPEPVSLPDRIFSTAKYLLPMTPSSFVFIRMDPANRGRDSSFGNTPTTLILRFFLLTRSIMFVVLSLFQCCLGNAVQLLRRRKNRSILLPAFWYPWTFRPLASSGSICSLP